MSTVVIIDNLITPATTTNDPNSTSSVVLFDDTAQRWDLPTLSSNAIRNLILWFQICFHTNIIGTANSAKSIPIPSPLWAYIKCASASLLIHFFGRSCSQSALCSLCELVAQLWWKTVHTEPAGTAVEKRRRKWSAEPLIFLLRSKLPY